MTSCFVRRQAAPFEAATTSECLLALNELIEAGKIAPVIDRSVPSDAEIAGVAPRGVAIGLTQSQCGCPGGSLGR